MEGAAGTAKGTPLPVLALHAAEIPGVEPFAATLAVPQKDRAGHAQNPALGLRRYSPRGRASHTSHLTPTVPPFTK